MRLPTFLLLGLMLGCGPARLPAGPDADPIPGITLPVYHSIDEVDLCVAGDSLTCVAWVETVRDSTSPFVKSLRVFFQRRTTGAGWTIPVLVAEEKGSSRLPVRIISNEGSIHVFFGKHLRHFISTDSGRSWRELDAVCSGTQLIASGCDVAARGDELFLAYLARERASDGAIQLGVWICAVSGEGLGARTLVARFDATYSAGPCPSLCIQDSAATLLFAVRSSTASQKAKVFCSRTNGSIRLWLPPREVSQVRGQAPSIAYARSQRKEFAFYNAWGLYGVERQVGGDWSAPVLLNSAQHDYRTESVSVACGKEYCRLVWIDSRFTRRDVAGEYPEWANNDVLTGVLADAASGMVPLKATRLTSDLAMATRVVARASPSAVCVVWAGRAKVGKFLDSFHSRPALFFTVMSFDSPHRVDR